MADYVISVVVMSAVLGFVAYASYPESASKASRFAASVLLLYVAVNPLGKIVRSLGGGSGLSDLIDKPPPIIEEGEYLTVAEEAFVEGVSKLLFTKYGIEPENVSIKTEGFDFQSMSCAKIKITLSGKGAFGDFRAIEEYISECGLGECEVYLKIG